MHHFTEWNDKKQDRYTYAKTGYEIRVILTTPTRAALLEKYLIQKMQPRDCKMKYDSYLSDTQAARAKEIHEAAPVVDIDDMEEVPF